MPKWLTKSKYLNGLQCPKLLWIAVNEPERIPEPDAATRQVFDQGHLVGELARSLYPDGIIVPDDDFIANIRLTKQFLKQRKPLFEAGIRADRLYSRVDILKPANGNGWDIVEVKSATSVKDINIDDISFQKLVCEESGISINKCYLVFLNNKYVRHGELNPQELFIISDVTEDAASRAEGIRKRVEELFSIMDSTLCPEAVIGPHCSNPYECSLSECRAGWPEHNVFTLYTGGKKSYELYRNGIIDICTIPEGFDLNEKQQIQFDCVRSGKVHLNKGQVGQFLAQLVYPLYYLDFETIGPALPLFDESRPYQNIPFQYSLHVQSTPGAKPEHFWFLAEGQTDPRPALLENLKKVIGPEGSLLAYNKSFEEHVLRESAEAFPEYAKWVEYVNSRILDLIVPFRSFSYYNPQQKGSASLKKVLPAVTGRGYEGMDIGEGGEASRRFLEITFGDALPEEVRQTRESLLEYCGQDTEGMVQIVEALRKMVD